MAHNAHTGEFAPGDRVFSHYTMSWGTVLAVDHVADMGTHETVWYRCQMDDASGQDLLDDAGGNWEMARIVPPAVAQRYGYGTDPKEGK